ncbi:ROK family transcriptional regulator [Herbiconiux sp. 11R-BC]|uniref:ROK family transcriptional regulator n=1 Tax=Herbiconiux sp. 11R-BC TaxID=3111637 RepID=UPI003BFEE819
MNDNRFNGRREVLTELLSAHRTTRVDVASTTGLSPATVSRAVDALVSEGIVRETRDIHTGMRGRRAVLLEVVPDLQHVAGVDLGATTTRVVIANFLGEPVRSVQVPTPTDKGSAALGQWLAGIVKDAHQDYRPPTAVAVGLPGAVKTDDRSVSNAPNRREVEDPAFLGAFQSHLGVTAEIDNDANFALLGEQKFGAARDAPTAAMMTIGAGLGCAMSIDGRIIRGRRGIVGEFGHLLVGPLGSRLENMVTGPMLRRRAQELGHELDSPADLFRSDRPAVLDAVVSQFDQALMVALTALIVSSDPAVVVLGGGIAKSLTSRLGRYEEAIASNLNVFTPVVNSQLGDFSGAMGAVVACLQSVYEQLGVSESDLSRLPAARPLGQSELSPAFERRDAASPTL